MRNKSTRLVAVSLLASVLLLANSAFAQWQITDAPGFKIDTDQPLAQTDGYALVGINNAMVGVYDIATGVLIRNIDLPKGPAIEMRTFAADSGRLLVSDSIFAPNPVRGHSRAYSFDIATGQQLAELELQSPTQRLALGQTLATDGERGILSSIKCIAKCTTPDPTLRGVIDVFDLETGEHLIDIVHADDSHFGQALDIDRDVVAVASRSHDPLKAGNVHLFDASSGDALNTIVPNASPAAHHAFGSALAMENGRIVVGDGAFSSGSGGPQGIVNVFDVASGKSIADFNVDKIGLEGAPRFGHSVDFSGEYIIAGAPASGTNASGSVVIANVMTSGYVSQTTWSGGDSVAIDGNYALVRSESNTQTSVYSVSLVGLLPPGSNAVSGATAQTLGDLNGDGTVAFADFLALSQNFGIEVAGVAHGDLDSNGIVGFSDFLILSQNFGKAFSDSQIVTPVPEPAITGWLGFIGFVVVAVNRKRRNA